MVLLNVCFFKFHQNILNGLLVIVYVQRDMSKMGVFRIIQEVTLSETSNLAIKELLQVSMYKIHVSFI